MRAIGESGWCTALTLSRQAAHTSLAFTGLTCNAATRERSDTASASRAASCCCSDNTATGMVAVEVTGKAEQSPFEGGRWGSRTALRVLECNLHGGRRGRRVVGEGESHVAHRLQ